MRNEDLLKRIRKERQQRRISLRDLGEMLGVTGQYISMIERGKAPLKMDDYVKICDILEISPIKLLMEEENEREFKALIEKIYSLSERDFNILTTMIELMQ